MLLCYCYDGAVVMLLWCYYVGKLLYIELEARMLMVILVG